MKRMTTKQLEKRNKRIEKIISKLLKEFGFENKREVSSVNVFSTKVREFRDLTAHTLTIDFRSWEKRTK